ncbi:MAG: MarR family transcriptional regulator [Coprobacter sp.]|nr:MarR family transcriptional regulator [Coprobacter sp.]
MNFSTLDIETVFVVLSGKISAAINRKMYRSFRKENIDITPEQWSVLYYLWEKDGVNQQELCNATFKDKPSMTRLIDNLEKQQLVTRTTSQHDRRINIINLTEKGRKLDEMTQPVVTRTKEVALQGLTDEEIVLAQQLLNKVFSNIKKSLDK